MIFIACLNPIDNIEVVETTQFKCDAETALSKLYDYFSIKDATMDYQVKYDDLGLAYITYKSDYTSGEFTYKPLWYVTGDFNMLNTPDKIRFTDKFVDPVTGIVFDTTE